MRRALFGLRRPGPTQLYPLKSPISSILARRLQPDKLSSRASSTSLSSQRYLFHPDCYHQTSHNNYTKTATANLSSTTTNVNSSRTNSCAATRAPSRLVVGRHVREALANGSPIVALESTVITHGLPEPQNLELALRLEAEIADGYWWQSSDRDEPGGDTSQSCAASSGGLMKGQVTPATVGIVKGQLVIGLSHDELEYLATRDRSRPIKASRRDIPIALARRLSAGTTVSATMAIASSLSSSSSSPMGHALGRPAIKVFATGGMGGVHRGGELSMDISADLYEFARSPIGVVSSGFKSFLDTRRSLEFLETMGATVVSLEAGEDIYEAKRFVRWSENGRLLVVNQNSADVANKNSEQRQQQLAERAQRRDNKSRKDDDDDNPGGVAPPELASSSSPPVSGELAAAHLFPGFFSTINKEQVPTPWQCQTVQEAAEILFECLEQQQQNSAPSSEQSQVYSKSWQANGRAMLLASPIPKKFSLNLEEDLDYQRAMANIHSIDGRTDLSGKDKTPLILEQLNRETGGKTLEANIQLLRNNARVGAHLAYEYARLLNSGRGPHSTIGEFSAQSFNTTTTTTTTTPNSSSSS